MNNTASISFDDTILSGLATRDTTSGPLTALMPVSAPVPPMPESLWRHTLQEHSAQRRYRIMLRLIFAVIAVLGAGSVAFAVWQTCGLMAGDNLQDAVGLLMR
jgi:hypothetical protein